MQTLESHARWLLDPEYSHLDLPYITEDREGIGHQSGTRIVKFEVEELPLYEPDGQGPHLFINITKEGLNTRDIARRLASLFRLKSYDIGYAGLKDKYARVKQTFSILVGDVDFHFLTGAVGRIEANLPVKVNWTKLHRKKLRVGHLLGNKFSIVITGLRQPLEDALRAARAVANKLREKGLPNYYGPQRVGIEGKNMRRGLEIIQGRRSCADRWLRRFLVSSYLSHLCNQYLARRVESGKFGHILKGDIAKKYATGGMFEVEDAEREQARYENHEISFTAPIFGPKMWAATGPSGKLEEDIWSESKIDTIREGLSFNFTLPKGAFATTVLREIMKPNKRE